MLHLAAFDSAVGVGSNFTQVNALFSQFDNTQNNNLVVGAQPMITRAAAIGANLTRTQLRSPTLQIPANPDILFVIESPTAGPATLVVQVFDSVPMKLKPNEQLQAFAINALATGTENEIIAVWLVDQPLKPVAVESRTVRLTGTFTLTAQIWTTGALAFEPVLPVGSYDVIGMRAQSAGSRLARLGVPGLVTRPGVYAPSSTADDVDFIQRYGAMGVIATFASTVVLSADFLSVSADTSEVVNLDIVGPK